MTPISRRHALLLLGASASLAVLPRLSFATEEMVAGRISEVTGGKAAGDLEIYLDMPDIAENGNQVNGVFH